jgi:cbb3-type cytochrome oxidase subunit 3
VTSRTEMRSIEGERSILLRRVVLFGVPLLYLVRGVSHPTSNPELGDETGPFIGLHFAQLFLIGGLAYLLWLLVEGLDGRAARVARAALAAVFLLGGHPFPFGTIAFGCFFIGAVLYEFRTSPWRFTPA